MYEAGRRWGGVRLEIEEKRGRKLMKLTVRRSFSWA
jgi:hypothetical protein